MLQWCFQQQFTVSKHSVESSLIRTVDHQNLSRYKTGPLRPCKIKHDINLMTEGDLESSLPTTN